MKLIILLILELATVASEVPTFAKSILKFKFKFGTGKPRFQVPDDSEANGHWHGPSGIREVLVSLARVTARR